ncbi:hypothetical protein MAR_014886 [Mya arenaria]|uniref:Uncharacterized protein n=1 Tax=Mya arenaria TaxID=6604 RepID=A0ABY7FH34_MYAAR|nr:hypothetical protein MAR_014886 [Mya arenaria]
MAEVDANGFWKLMNKRRHCGKSKLCSGINFKGTVVRDPKVITDGWADYFRDLYTPSDIADDYIDWERSVTAEVQDTIASLEPDRNATVLPDTP